MLPIVNNLNIYIGKTLEHNADQRQRLKVISIAFFTLEDWINQFKTQKLQQINYGIPDHDMKRNIL